ncbi:MAG: thermonuclease family protein [candidate division Zixibacteria bacterium]|nr:thermonuclease family protein [candidate division Zixibacteria bacterium]
MAVLAAAVVIFRLTGRIGQDVGPDDRFVVVRVIDGDTVELKGGDILRLLAVDAPEKDDPYYEEAREFLTAMTLGKPVRITYGGGRRDRYGRLLGFLYVDDTMVNQAILANGLGYLYLFRENTGLPEIAGLLTAQKEAIASGRGLWAAPRSPEDYYINKSGSFRFHRPGCRSIGELRPGTYRIIATREEACAEGLSPCRNCRP